MNCVWFLTNLLIDNIRGLPQAVVQLEFSKIRLKFVRLVYHCETTVQLTA